MRGEQRHQDFVAKSIRAWEQDRKRQKRREAPYRPRGRSALGALRHVYGIAALMILMAVAAGLQAAPGLTSGTSSLLGSGNTVSRGSGGIQKTAARNFPLCGAGKRINCVVDGDTFWIDGKKVRIADINAPEVSSPKCGAEKSRGDRATRRLQGLLNSGKFEMQGSGTDKYGRTLRTLHRNGRSLGDTMVGEGLAHRWNGHKESWCG